MNFLLPIEVRSFYTQKKKYRVHLLDTNGILKGSLLPSAGDRTRTGTISRRILSAVRLPIPPHRHAVIPAKSDLPV